MPSAQVSNISAQVIHLSLPTYKVASDGATSSSEQVSIYMIVHKVLLLFVLPQLSFLVASCLRICV